MALCLKFQVPVDDCVVLEAIWLDARTSVHCTLGETITELLFENNSQEDVGERNLQLAG